MNWFLVYMCSIYKGEMFDNICVFLEEIDFWVNDYFRRYNMGRRSVVELVLWNLKI